MTMTAETVTSAVNPDEQEVIDYLMRNWPDKFDEPDILHWRRRLRALGIPFRVVRDLLVEWKNSMKGRFAPSIDEVAALAPRKQAAAAPTRSTVIATNVLQVMADAELARRSDAELHLVYYRGQYLARQREIERFARQCTRAVTGRELDELADWGATQARLCERDLFVLFGVSEDDARSLAISVWGDDETFDAALERLSSLARCAA